MKKMRLHNLVTALVMVCMAGFWGCKDDDVDSQGPFITPNPATLAFDASGDQLTKSIAIESNREWTATFLESGVDAWITADTKSGSGNGKINISVLPNDGAERSATLKLVASTASVSVKITQYAEGGGTVGEILYKENCGTSVEKVDNKWPFVDQYTGWERGGSLDQKAVAYTGSSANVSNSGNAFAPGEGSPFSGAPYVGMNTAASQFEIGDINITGNTNFTFKFGAIFQSDYQGGSVFGDVVANSFALSASVDGTNWSPLTYTVSKPGAGNWFQIASEFKVPAGSTKLYIKYATTNVGANQGYRFDDFTLYVGGNGELIQPGGTPGGDTGEVDPYPTTAVTSFSETFEDVVNNKPFTSSQWGFYSSDSNWPADAYLGWHGRVFNNTTTGSTDKYLACAPYGSSLSEVSAYAIMAPFNVKDAASKTLTFDLAWFYQNADNSQLEVVASTDFAGNVKTATWTVLKNCTFAAGTATNEWFEQSIDLSANYASATKVYVAFRYKGKDITYRLDNVAFGAQTLTFGTPSFSATTIKVGSPIVGGKITIPYTNAVGTEMYNITVAVGGDAAPGIDPITVAVAKTLTAGGGNIELDITGTPSVAGEVVFNIVGIAGLTTTTISGTVTAAGTPVYTSNISLPVANNSTDAYYAEKAKIDGAEYPVLKLGTGSKVGTYTMAEALPKQGDLALSFYAVAWNGKTSSVKITVNNGGTIDGETSKTFALSTGEAGAVSTSPYTLTLSSSDLFTASLTGVTAATTLTIESVKGSDNRAILVGLNVN